MYSVCSESLGDSESRQRWPSFKKTLRYVEGVFRLVLHVYHRLCNRIMPISCNRIMYKTFTVESTLVGSKILKKGKCICKTIEMCFKGLLSVPIYVRSIEKHVRHLV